MQWPLKMGTLVLAAAVVLVVGAVDESDPRCSVHPDGPSVERFGGDYSGVPLVAGVNATLADCAADRQCVALLFNHPQPAAVLYPLCERRTSGVGRCMVRVSLAAEMIGKLRAETRHLTGT
jgi:hypothetical protein